MLALVSIVRTCIRRHQTSGVNKVQIIRAGSQQNVSCHVATRLKTMFAAFTINETFTKCSANYSIISNKAWEVVRCSTKNLTPGMTQRREVQYLELQHLPTGFHIITLFTKHHVGSRNNGHQWDKGTKDTTWANSWKALRQLCGGDIHSAAHPWIFDGSFGIPTPATTAGCSHNAMRYQLLSDASSDVLHMFSVSALVSGMRASGLECSASERKGMFVMQCT